MHKTYYPQTLDEALSLMANHDLQPVAGGTDAMIRARNWQGASRNFKKDIILISHLKALKTYQETQEAYILGSGMTQSQLLTIKGLPDYVYDVVSQMATPAIRNVATLGGNIANAASVADLLPLLYAMDAQVVLISSQGQRTLAIEDFEVSKYKTACRPDELVFKIILPKLKVTKYTYTKIGQRKASILSKLSFVGFNTPTGMRIAIGALNDKVIRSRTIEEDMLRNKDKRQVLKAYQALFDSHDDKRSTKAYKERVALNLLNQWMEDNDE